MARGRSQHSRAVIALVVVMTAAFAVQLAGVLEGGDWALHANAFVAAWGEVTGGGGGPESWRTLSTLWAYALVHGGVEHLGYNLVFLWLFGSLVHDAVGERGVIVSALVTTATAGLLFTFRHLGETPDGVIGCSGLGSGLAGVYVLLAFRWSEMPRAHAWPLARPVPPMQAAAFAILFVIGDLFLLRSNDGTAHDAHLGGFGGGLLLAMILTTFFPTWRSFLGSKIAPEGLAERR